MGGPLDHLGDSWTAYREATANLKAEQTWMPAERTHRWFAKGTDEAVAIAVESLQQHGFQVRAATQEAAARLRNGAEKTRALVDAADAHLARMVQKLAERGLKPRPYQMVGIRWLRATKAGALLDVMGLGKTMQCLLAMGDRGIVLCPASVKGVWVRECKLWRPDLRTVRMQGYDSFRWPKEGELLIYNYELIRVERPVVAPFAGTVLFVKDKHGHPLPPNAQGKVELTVRSGVRVQGAYPTKTFKVPAARLLVKDGQAVAEGEQLFQSHEDVAPAGPAPHGCFLVIDEAHNLKNPKAMRSRAGKAVATAVRDAGGHTVAATATPICNRASELRAILELIGAFGTAFTSEAAFKKAFGGNVDDVEEVKPTPEAAAALARVSLRRSKSDVRNDLPPMSFETRELELSGEAKVVAENLERELRPLVEAAEAEAAAAGKSAEELAKSIEQAITKQMSIGAMSKARRIIALAKLPAAIEIIESLEDAGDLPVLVISAHRETCEALVARDPKNWRMIIGDVPDRDQIVEDFQSGKLKGLAITIRSGGVGLTLTRAAYGIAIDREWNPAVNDQAFGRIDPVRGRPAGVADGPSHWFVLQGDSWIEQRLEELLKLKSEMIRQTVDPVAKLGGQLPKGADLEAVAVGLPETPSGKARAKGRLLTGS
ncbi:SNF2-related protein [Nannocystis pusilla]|uniref:SNF2-related protein n=1 Tax=Nannocystis pusilla TaxID=889268 RepID=UPI003B7E96B5